jgi:hypothetical protein
MNRKAWFVRYPTETKRGRRQMSLICDLPNLQRSGLIDPIPARKGAWY